MKGGSVEFDINFKVDQIDAKVSKVENEIRNIGKAAEQSVSQTGMAFNKLGGYVTAFLSLNAAQQFATQLITVRGQFEQLGIALETILGSKEKATALTAEIANLAAKTPFTLTEVGQGAKQLLAFGVAQENVIDRLTRLGNVAAGVSAPVGELIRAYGQVKAKGKLQAEEINQFAEKGIPLVSELAKVLGVTNAEVLKMTEQGKVGFGAVEAAMNNLTNEGGMFFNMMEKQSKSVTGMASNLGDAWDKMFNDIGQSNEGIIKGSISGLTNLVQNYEEVLKIVAGLVSVYGAYRAAIIVTNVAQTANAAIAGVVAAEHGMITTAKAAQIIVTERLMIAQAKLNVVMLANPFAIIATAMAAVIAYCIIYKKEVDSLAIASEKMNKVNNDVAVAVSQQIEPYKKLSKALKDTKPDTEERIKAVKELKEKYGDLFPKIDLVKLTEDKLNGALADGNGKLRERVTLTELLAQKSKAATDIQLAKEKYEQGYTNVTNRETLYKTNNSDYNRQQLAIAKKQREDLLKEYFAATSVEAQINNKIAASFGKPSTQTKTDDIILGGAAVDKTQQTAKKKQLDDYYKMLEDEWQKELDAHDAYLAEWKRQDEAYDKETDAIVRNAEKQEDDREKLLESLRNYEEEKQAIVEEYDAKRKLLGSGATEQQLAILKNQETNATNDLAQTYADRVNKYADMVEKVIALGNKAIDAKVKEVNAIIEADKTLAPAQVKEMKKRIAKLAEESKKANNHIKIQASIDGVDEIGRSISVLNQGIGSSLSLLADMAAKTATVAEGWTKLTSLKDWKTGEGFRDNLKTSTTLIGLIVTGISEITKLFSYAGDKVREYTAELERQNQLIDDQNYLLDSDTRRKRHNGDEKGVYGNAVTKQKNATTDYNNAVEAYNKALKDVNYSVAKHNENLYTDWAGYWDGRLADERAKLKVAEDNLKTKKKDLRTANDNLEQAGWDYDDAKAERAKQEAERAANEDKARLQRLKEYNEAEIKAFEDFRQAFNDMAGYSEQTLGDAILAGFENGANGVDLLGGKINDMLRNVMVEQFQQKYFAPMFEKMFNNNAVAAKYDYAGYTGLKNMAATGERNGIKLNVGQISMINETVKAMENGTLDENTAFYYGSHAGMGNSFLSLLDGKLTVDEASILGTEAKDTGGQMQSDYDTYLKPALISAGLLTKPDDPTATGMQGSINSMSEETAGIMTGALNGIRVNVIEQLAISKQGLDQLNKIQANTLATANNTALLKDIKTLLTPGATLRASGL